MRTSLLSVVLFILLRGLPAHAEATREPLIYVANFGSATVSVIDTAGNEVVSEIPVPLFPTELTATPNGESVLVASFEQFPSPGSVSIISTTDNTLRATLPVGTTPSDVAVTPDGRYAYVTNLNSGNLSIVDISAAAVVDVITVRGHPRAVSFAPDGATAYVALSAGILFAVDVNSKQVMPEVGIGYRAVDIATDPTRPVAYVVDPGPDLLGSDGSIVEGDLRIVDALNLSVMRSVPLGSQPMAITVDSDGRHAYVPNRTARNVSIIDLSAEPIVERRVSLGSQPFDVAALPGSRYLYVSEAFADMVAIIDTSTDTVVSEVAVGDSPTGLAVVPAQQESATSEDGCALRAGSISKTSNLGVAFGGLILLSVLRLRRGRIFGT